MKMNVKVICRKWKDLMKDLKELRGYFNRSEVKYRII